MKFEDSIQRTIDYIDANLLQDLSLEEIARQSGYSLSHFYKVFPAITGCSIKEFVRNKRLALAARQLISTRDRILDIALEYGFESQEVFTRAFIALYGVTPGEFRKHRKGAFETFDQMDAFAQQMQLRSHRQPFEIPVRSEIIRRSEMHLVGMQFQTNIAENIAHLSIPRFWQEKFLPRLGEINQRVTQNTTIAFEISDPFTEQLLHMAAVEVSDPQPPPGMTARSLEPGYSAVFTPQRSLDPYEYSALVRYAYGEWFPMSGCEIRADYTLDLYSKHASRDGKSIIQQLSVLIPIHPPHRNRAYREQPKKSHKPGNHPS